MAFDKDREKSVTGSESAGAQEQLTGAGLVSIDSGNKTEELNQENLKKLIEQWETKGYVERELLNSPDYLAFLRDRQFGIFDHHKEAVWVAYVNGRLHSVRPVTSLSLVKELIVQKDFAKELQSLGGDMFIFPRDQQEKENNKIYPWMLADENFQAFVKDYELGKFAQFGTQWVAYVNGEKFSMAYDRNVILNQLEESEHQWAYVHRINIPPETVGEEDEPFIHDKFDSDDGDGGFPRL